MATEIERADPETGELITVTEQPLAVQLAQAELNQAVTTAKAFPRSITTAVNNIMTLATLDEETAKESVYALPRGGKPIKGPSIRFAEIVASQWGNCHTGSRVVAVDKFEKVVIAEGVFLDLETGMKRTAQIRRRIVDKNGRLYNDDMIVVTGNAAASIAMREAILKGIPKAVWRKAYERCESVIAGDVKTLAVNRDEAIKAFAVWGIKPEQIFSALDVGGLDDIGLNELGTLRAMFKAIKDGDQKVEDYFPAVADQTKAADAAKGTAAKLGKIAEEGQKASEEKAKPEPEKKADEKAESKPAKTEEAAPKETAAEDQPAAQEANAAETTAEGEGDQDDAGGDTAGPSAEEIDAAFDRGEEAFVKGIARRAVPTDYRAEGKEQLMEAWLQGHDRASGRAGK